MKDMLRGKAVGITISIDKMDGKHRQGFPSRKFGEDYNLLRDAVMSQFPDMGPLMPPGVGTMVDATHLTDASYAEVRTYAEQISQMLGGLGE